MTRINNRTDVTFVWVCVVIAIFATVIVVTADAAIVITDERNEYEIQAAYDRVLIQVAYDRDSRVNEWEQAHPDYPHIYRYWPAVIVPVTIEGDGKLIGDKRQRTLLQDWTGEPDPEPGPMSLRYSWSNYSYPQTVDVLVGPAGCKVRIGPDTITLKPKVPKTES